ncbi:hypothetical protein KFU94_42985 [Chloroflexi bacterium TSY]|nr:hypothetical protein [Chloroflexi bacterium TSY]
MMFPVDLPGTPFRRFLQFSAHFEERLVEMIHERRGKIEQGQDALFSHFLA